MTDNPKTTPCATCAGTRKVLRIHSRGPNSPPGNSWGSCPVCTPSGEWTDIPVRAPLSQTIQLLIRRGDEALLDIGEGECVLLPGREEEREAVFRALVDALALLAGLMPQCREVRRAADVVELRPVP